MSIQRMDIRLPPFLKRGGGKRENWPNYNSTLLLHDQGAEHET